ncbi:MAG: nitroreductase [Anaerosporomusa subterranea]|jgi:nitroreductase|nr:nitroreductase [Anaerosporomusa subterranea]
MNDILKAIKSRRSVRSFSDKQITDNELQAVLEAAQYAPTAGSQPWQFIAIQKEELINELSNASKEVVKNHEVEFIRKMANNKDFHAFYNAPTVILVCGDESLWTPADCAAATQNILLAAESLGLAACWINFGLFVFSSESGSKYNKLLGIPEGYSPLYSVALGYRRGAVPAAAPRKKNVVTCIK